MSTTGETNAVTAEEQTETASEREAQANANRRQRFGQGFLDTISTGWAERPESTPPAREQAAYAAARRDAVWGVRRAGPAPR